MTSSLRFRFFPTALAVIGVILLNGCDLLTGPQPPLARLQSAKDALERAANSGSIRYAEDAYREAERLIQSGWMEMARQNGRTLPFRNYDSADSLLRRAEAIAEAGLRRTQDSLNTLDRKVWGEIKDFQNELFTWRDALDGSLIIFIAERLWTDAELQLNTARELARHKEFEEAERSVARGRSTLIRLGAMLAERAGNEEASLRNWRRWVDDAIGYSEREQTYLIVVVKSTHKTYLIQNGRPIHVYQSELGYNSANPKLFAGDGATPEGVYKVTKVKIGDTKFYKALLLNYPNDADKARFEENKRRGIISRGSGIGRLIEIHGDGGNGSDWTDGCVALSNKDMDHLTKYAGVGTPVVIVRRYDGGNLK